MKLKLKRLEDQVVVITGGTSGIGLATAKRAADRGARVVLCSRNERELQDTVATIEEHGGRAKAVVADVSSQSDVERLAATAIEEFGARSLASGEAAARSSTSAAWSPTVPSPSRAPTPPRSTRSRDLPMRFVWSRNRQARRSR